MPSPSATVHPSTLAASTLTAGTPNAGPVTLVQLLEIYPMLEKNPKTAQDYLDKLNEAFTIMKFDTVESRSLFLAHAAAESGQFTKLTESQRVPFRTGPISNPNAELLVGDLEKKYPLGGTVNTTGHWPSSYIGRGPLQLTDRQGYRDTADFLDRAAAARSPQDPESVRLRGAAKALRKDPQAAADPTYAFLVSAAFLKMRGGDRRSMTRGKTFSGTGPESNWMTGGNTDNQAGDKLKAWNRAVDVLSR
jgi:predicted chitinase